uniref:Uncharacterized protein n=1 Tax=Caenorhabditis japonica TaxID=281687 RepID=A0A8R1E9E7_CAEJA
METVDCPSLSTVMEAEPPPVNAEAREIFPALSTHTATEAEPPPINNADPREPRPQLSAQTASEVQQQFNYAADSPTVPSEIPYFL